MHCRKVKWSRVLGSAGECWGGEGVAIVNKVDGKPEGRSTWHLWKTDNTLSSFHRWRNWGLEYKNFFSRIYLLALLIPESSSSRSICYNFLPSSRTQNYCTQLRNYVSRGYAQSVRKRKSSIVCGSYSQGWLRQLAYWSPSWARMDLSAWCYLGFHGHRRD